MRVTSRRDALLALPLLCGAPGVRAQAPKAGPPKRMGVLNAGFEPQMPGPQRPFYLALREKGWILGDNLEVEPAFADGKIERVQGLAEELVRKRVDVILVIGDFASVIAARATRTIPIVFTFVLFPVEQGLIDSFARPGRNVTGRSEFAGVEVTLKRLQLLREAAPNAKRLSWLSGGTSPITVSGAVWDLRPMLEATAKDMGFETRFHDWSALPEIDAIFGDVTAWRAQAVTAGTGWVFDGRQRVAELALRHRLPSAFMFRQVVEAGGLLSYGAVQSQAETANATRQIAGYVDRILRGTPPAELPVERPNRYELVINMKTANALGLTIPQSLLLRADEVIQ
jgi:putative tryptophan/tyrosine transport system substrate-binding protein